MGFDLTRLTSTSWLIEDQPIMMKPETRKAEIEAIEEISFISMTVI